MSSHSQNAVALQLRLDAESTPGDHRSTTWKQAADLIERLSGPSEHAAPMACSPIASTAHSLWIVRVDGKNHCAWPTKRQAEVYASGYSAKVAIEIMECAAVAFPVSEAGKEHGLLAGLPEANEIAAAIKDAARYRRIPTEALRQILRDKYGSGPGLEGGSREQIGLTIDCWPLLHATDSAKGGK